jgi:enoyl-CoA hydratase/carnithine racemase
VTNDDDLVLRTDHGAVRVLTLNRPQARNALNRGLIRALYAALKVADDDASVRAVVLTGTDPAFCAGIAEMRTPIVGAINGSTFTGGLELALGCDFLIASERAVFADTHARVGILPGGGMTARLPQVVGGAMARRMSMTGEVVDAVRAERIGLVTEVVVHDGLLSRAVELAAKIAGVPKPTMLGLKEIYVRGASAVVDPALAAEAAIAGAHEHDLAGLDQRRLDVIRDNKSQIGTITP